MYRGISDPFEAEMARASAALLSLTAGVPCVAGAEMQGGPFEQIRPAGALPAIAREVLRPAVAALLAEDAHDAREAMAMIGGVGQ